MQRANLSVANKMKRAELSMETLVVTILALIVLVVLVYVFRTQIGEIFSAFSKLIKSSVGEVP